MKRSLRTAKKNIQTENFIQSSQSPAIQETVLYDKVTRVEQNIFMKIYDIKKKKMNFSCEHTGDANLTENYSNNEISPLPSDVMTYDKDTQYYDKFWKLFLLNEMANYKVDQMEKSLKQVQSQCQEIKELFSNRDQLLQSSHHMISKKGRRKEGKGKNVWIKMFDCPYSECLKVYLSDISLNLHMRVKHSASSKTEREVAAQMYWSSSSLDKDLIKDVNFPPGYLEECGMKAGRISQQSYESLKKEHKWKEKCRVQRPLEQSDSNE